MSADRILVTGSSGHLGEGLVRVLRDRGVPVTGLDVLPSAFTDVTGSITDRDVLRDCLAGVRAVVHAATLHKPHVGSHDRQAFVDTHPVGYAAVGPSFWGDGVYPPTDAVYYPLYAKCCELELPLCMNTGIPGPPIPAEPQNPIHLDRVCVRFPELKLCMIHGADPWWDTAIRLMLKYRNLRLMTSAWSPKRLPESLLHFMRTRGKGRIMFASDHPVLPLSRVMPEALALDLPDDVRDGWLYGNADEFFFGRERVRR